MRIDINMDFPECMSMEIQYNDHKNCYETAEEYFENDFLRQEVTDEDYEKCVELNTVWSIRWYPSTPIGFYSIYTYSLERCLEILHECQDGEGYEN